MLPKHLPRQFKSTRWTLVNLANGGIDPEAQKALAALCELYWYPIYGYIRRCGHDAHEAEDLTQGFFSRLIQKGTLAHADQSKGKLRTFLLTCVKNYLHNEHARAGSLRRGGLGLNRFDHDYAEERLAHEPSHNLTPDRLYQRRWAMTLLKHSLQILEEEYNANGKTDLFTSLRPSLGFSQEQVASYAELAIRMGSTEGNVRTQVFRLRQRWREILLQQVSLTLEDPTSDEIRGELAELLECV